jgi:hypothetical protein
MTMEPEFAVVRHDYMSGHDYRVVRLVDVDGVTYGLTVNGEGVSKSWQTYTRKPDAFAAARKLGTVRREIMRETYEFPVMHALKSA